MMKTFSAGLLLSLVTLTAFSQSVKKDNNTLLWKISGNGISKPSYLFGTIHILCKDDAFLSKNLRDAISKADRVYLELDMDNVVELLGMISKMKMKNDTTLADLLSKEDYEKVKSHFEGRSTMFPFSAIETYKPLIASSLLMESGLSCDESVAMETLVMEEAKRNGKRVDGLESMAYQMSIFDSIPYKVQAEELLKAITPGDRNTVADQEFKTMMKAYRDQDLEKLGELITKTDAGMMQYQDILLNNRNRNWVAKLMTLLADKSLVVAVGAGHLPGENGVINLLRKEGYEVTPVDNSRADLRDSL